MDKIKLTEKNKRWIGILVLALFLVMNVIIILNHEHWRDEGNTWQMAKVLNPVELLRAVDGEGHPLLWSCLIFAIFETHFMYFGFAAALCLQQLLDFIRYLRKKEERSKVLQDKLKEEFE